MCCTEGLDIPQHSQVGIIARTNTHKHSLAHRFVLTESLISGCVGRKGWFRKSPDTSHIHIFVHKNIWIVIRLTQIRYRTGRFLVFGGGRRGNISFCLCFRRRRWRRRPHAWTRARSGRHCTRAIFRFRDAHRHRLLMMSPDTCRSAKHNFPLLLLLHEAAATLPVCCCYCSGDVTLVGTVARSRMKVKCSCWERGVARPERGRVRADTRGANIWEVEVVEVVKTAAVSRTCRVCCDALVSAVLGSAVSENVHWSPACTVSAPGTSSLPLRSAATALVALVYIQIVKKYLNIQCLFRLLVLFIYTNKRTRARKNAQWLVARRGCRCPRPMMTERRRASGAVPRALLALSLNEDSEPGTARAVPDTLSIPGALLRRSPLTVSSTYLARTLCTPRKAVLVLASNAPYLFTPRWCPAYL